MKFTFGKLESLFAFLVMIFGILIIYLTPPMCSPDENTHFICAYSVSSGDFFPAVEDGKAGRWLPENVYEFIVNNTGKLDGQYDEKYSYSDMFENRKYDEGNGQKIFMTNIITGVSPVSHIISGTGMFMFRSLCRIFGSQYASPYNLLLMGKFANLLFYCIVIYFALKITPYYKNVMFMIALMPMSIFLGASLNYDSILISSTLYYFAILMKILHSEEGYRITTKDIISVCFAAFWMVGIKQMYAPLLLLLFMVPVKKFKDKKQYITAIGSVVLTGIAAYLPAVIVNAKLSGIGNVQSEIEQKQYVMNHAVHFLYIMFRTFKEQLSSYMLSFVGSLGNLDTVFSAPVLFAFILMLLLVSIFDISRVPETALKLRISSAILLLFIIMASCYAMYVSWTSLPEIGGIGYPVVVGLQGRYFIPAYVFGIMIFSNRLLLDVPFFQKHISAVERKMDCLVKITMIMMGILTVLLLLLRYYI